ncbi:hypothetical protein HDR58_02300 [bacterium]|nr:hypothetical protein [bacterium]
MENSDLEQLKQPNNRKSKKRHSRKTGFYYSFLTIALIFCLIQIGYGAILNVTKIISYQGKTVTLQNLLKKAQMRNHDLKAEKKMVTSDNSLEGIARNNLKLAEEDEVLIIINQKVEEPKKKTKKWDFKGFKGFNIKKQEKAVEPAGEIYIPPEVIEE